jgi:hypothetical protein
MAGFYKIPPSKTKIGTPIDGVPIIFGSSPNRMGTPVGKYILLKKRVKKVGITLSANSPARNPD